jgi:hypothetical protein
LKFLIKKESVVPYSFQFFVIETLDPVPEPDPDTPEILNPDPDPDTMSPDPQHTLQLRESRYQYVRAKKRKHTKRTNTNFTSVRYSKKLPYLAASMHLCAKISSPSSVSMVTSASSLKLRGEKASRARGGRVFCSIRPSAYLRKYGQ